MGFIDQEQKQVPLPRSVGDDELEFGGSDASFVGDILPAAFRLENKLISAVSMESGMPDAFKDNPDFIPWDNFTEDEKTDDHFVTRAALADNMYELEAVRRQQRRELKDRAILSENVGSGFAAMMLAGGADPVNLIPIGGAAYKTYRTGASILKAGSVTAGTTAGVLTADEIALHYSQMERTYSESALNVSAGVLLGGVLGVGAGKLSRMMAEKPNLLKEIEESFDPEGAIADGRDSATGVSTVGAQQVNKNVKVRGKMPEKIVKALAFDPLSRTITSKSQATRNLVARMAESPIAIEGGIGHAVETKAKIHDGKYITALEGHLVEFKASQKTEFKTSRKKFNEQVASEIRNPSSKNPHVKKAAGSWVKHLYGPMKDEMVAARLLAEDIKPKTAIGYLNRSWSRAKITANLPAFTKIVTKWLDDTHGKAFEEMGVDSSDVAMDIANRIRSNSEGRLPYDYQIGENTQQIKSFEADGGKLKSPFQERSFTIPDKLVEEFLENDVETLGGRFLRQTATDVELTKEFGDINMVADLKDVDNEWFDLISKAKTEKERINLGKDHARDRRDIKGMLDRMRGVYGLVDPDNPWSRARAALRDLNYLRFMGGVVASSFPDVARIFMAEGFAKTFKTGIKPLVANLKTFKVSANEAKRWGVGVDGVLGGRAEIIGDVADYTQGGTMVERGLRSAAQKFGSVNLMNQWTSAVKQLHAVTMQTSVFDDLAKGKYDQRLGQLGISEDNAKAITAQFKKYGEKTDGVWIANTKDWDSTALAEIWGGALRKESDRVIVMPGQEKPLFMSSDMGKSIMQFRSFMFSSTQRMLIAGLQGQDANFVGGVLSLTTLGMMAYTFKQWDAGREITDDPVALVIEGMDRSGVLGVLMEINNTVEKTSRNNYGIRPLLDVELPGARFASRSQLSGVLGPTFGAFTDTALKVAGATADGEEWQDSDTRALRRLLPYQNLSILRQGFDKIEKAGQ